MINRLYFSVYLPKNLKLEEVIKKHAPKEIKHLKYYQYFITKIIDERIKNAQYSLNDYVRLKASYLNNIITSNHTKRIITNLVNWKIVEVDNQYVVGASSKSYRLTSKYRTEAFDVFKIKDHFIAAKIYHYCVAKRLEEIELKSVMTNHTIFYMLPYDFKCVNPFRNLIKYLDEIEIDSQAAMDYVNSVKFVKDKSRYTAFIQRIENKEHYFSFSEKVGRVFTTISNCPKSLLPFLSHNGKKLKEIDIANSQPLFLNGLLRIFKNEEAPDIELYRQLTSQGKLYNYLLKQCPSIRNLDELKDLLFKGIFFSKNSNGTNNDLDVYSSRFYIKMNELKRAFETSFPEVYNEIKRIKRKDYKELAIRLQQQESGIIIPLALKIAEGYPIFTKHDSLITTEDLAEQVKVVLDRELDFNNLKGTIRIK